MPVFDPAFDIAYDAGSFPPAFEIPTFPASVQRYITSLSAAGSMYFQPSTSPTITRIVMDVNSPTGSTVGLPTGAPAITANEFQTIDFAYSGTLPTFGKNGTDYFTGEIKNIKAYNGASLVWGAAIKEDWKTSTDLHDSDGNVVGSAINITEDEAEFYTKVDSGANWLGSDEYVTQNQTSSWDGTESDYAFKTLRTDSTIYFFRETLDLTDGVSGQLKIQSSASGASPFKNAGDIYTRDISHGTSNTLLQTSAGASKYVGDAKSSLKRLIPIAGGA